MGTDRRVKYTKMVLGNSLIKFLGEKPISRITIKEICEDADINRATYYSHYSDQFDQLKQIEADFISGITGYLAILADESDENDTVNMVGKIFEYISQNGELCRVLLGENGDIDFQNNLISILGERITGMWLSENLMNKPTAEYMLLFIATGSIGIVKKWLSEGCNQSAYDMAALLVSFANKGLMAFRSDKRLYFCAALYKGVFIR